MIEKMRLGFGLFVIRVSTKYAIMETVPREKKAPKMSHIVETFVHYSRMMAEEWSFVTNSREILHSFKIGVHSFKPRVGCFVSLLYTLYTPSSTILASVPRMRNAPDYMGRSGS